MKKNKGLVLIAVLAITVMIMLLGATALKMSELGYLTYGSQRRYQVAETAADYGISRAMEYAVNADYAGTSPCSASESNRTLNSGGVVARYSWFSGAQVNNKCFLFSKGTFGSATVVKTAVLPAGGMAPFGAVSIRNGGTLDLGGSSAVVNCDLTCNAPALIYGGTVTLQLGGSLWNDTICPNNPKGMYGVPYAVANGSGQQAYCPNPRNCTFSSATLPDLVPQMFNSTDWADLQNDLSGSYSGHTTDNANVPNLDMTIQNLLAAGVVTRPVTPTPACVCTGASLTLTSTTTTCAGGTGTITFATNCTDGMIHLSGAGPHILQGIPTGITNIVSDAAINIQSVPSSASFAGKNIFTTGTQNITINDSDVVLNNSQIVSAGSVTVTTAGAVTNSTISAGTAGTVSLQTTGNITGSNVIAGNGITMTSNVATIDNSHLIAEGSGGIAVNSGAGVSNSIIVTTLSDSTFTNGNITMQGGTVTGSTFVTKDQFIVQGSAGAMTNSQAFSRSITINKGAGDIAGGILYSQANTTIQGSGGGTQRVGTGANPTILLTGGNVNIDHTNGTTEFNGLVFSNGMILGSSVTGNYNINGAVVANGTGTGNSITAKGNAQISFRKDILAALANQIGGLMRQPRCGGNVGDRKPYIESTKLTVY